MLNIGWFSTGRGKGSQGLLNFVHRRLLETEADARINFVFSNRDKGEARGSDEFFRLVDSYGIPLVTHSSAKFQRRINGRFSAHREEYDLEVMDKLSGMNTDICVLAGYMLILSGKMCRQYPLLNLHPALPDGPIGTWQEVVWKLISNKAKKTGAMVHLATEEVDRGPVVSYVNVPIVGPQFDPHWESLKGKDLELTKQNKGEDLPLFQIIRSEQYKREPYLLFETLRAITNGQIKISEGQVLDESEGRQSRIMKVGLCLDRQISEAMAEISSADG